MLDGESLYFKGSKAVLILFNRYYYYYYINNITYFLF